MNALKLSGVQLDWAMAVALGIDQQTAIVGKPPAEWRLRPVDRRGYDCHPAKAHAIFDMGNGGYWMPSSSWDRGGPVLEWALKEGMQVVAIDQEYRATIPLFKATFDGWQTCIRGDTVLEATCRCIVAKKLGAEFELPKRKAKP